MSSDSRTKIVLLLVGLIVSVVATFVTNWTHAGFTKAEQIILGAVCFTALSLLELIWVVDRLESQRRKEVEFWDVADDASQRLHNIQNHFRHLQQEAYGPNDRFVNHFLDEFHRVESAIRDAAEKKELFVSGDHFLNVDDVLGAFDTRGDRVYRYTWPISCAGPLFTIPAWRQYFEMTSEMLRRRQITKIKVLVLVSDMDQLQAPNVAKLLDFYSCTKNAECRIATIADMSVVGSDHGIKSPSLDFGLYGENLLYVTEQDNPPDTIGKFTKDGHLITRYKKLFETVWSSQTLSLPNPSQCAVTVTLQDLLLADAAPMGSPTEATELPAARLAGA